MLVERSANACERSVLYVGVRSPACRLAKLWLLQLAEQRSARFPPNIACASHACARDMNLFNVHVMHRHKSCSHMHPSSPFTQAGKMKATVAVCLLYLAIHVPVGESFPTGAPTEACVDITPQPGHRGSPEDVDSLPYILNLTFFAGSEAYYIPDLVYTSKCLGHTIGYSNHSLCVHVHINLYVFQYSISKWCGN